MRLGGLMVLVVGKRAMATRVEQRVGGKQDREPGAPETAPRRQPWEARRSGLVAAALGVLALALFLHTYRLAWAPGWDPQEGYNLDLAWNLLHGRLRLFGLTSAFAQHPPLFYLQLALLIHVFGYHIETVRALATLYALLTCGAIMGFGRRLIGAGASLWAGLLFTVVPLFLANTRWGYTYAQLMLVALLCVWATWRYATTQTRHWLLVAAALAGLGVLSDYEGIALVGLVLLTTLRLRPRDAVPAMALALGLPVIGLGVCFAAAPGVFTADLADTLGRAAGGNLLLQLISVLINYYRFVLVDPFVLLGLAGLFLVPAPRPRAFLLAATATLAVVILKVRDLGPSFHTAVPLLPLLALGAGVALDAAVRHLYTWTVQWLGGDPTATLSPALTGGPRFPWPLPAIGREALTQRGRNALGALVVFLAIVSPLAIALASDAAGLTSQLATHQDATLATRPRDARAAAAYVLAHAHPGDVALGSPQVVWMLDQPDDAAGRPRAIYAADLLQAIAYQGREVAFYPAHLPHQRWAFDVSVGHARYVIVDNLLRTLAEPGQVPGLGSVLASVRSWPLVYARGEYSVYERPGSAPSGGGPALPAT